MKKHNNILLKKIVPQRHCLNQGELSRKFTPRIRRWVQYTETHQANQYALPYESKNSKFKIMESNGRVFLLVSVNEPHRLYAYVIHPEIQNLPYTQLLFQGRVYR